MIRFVGLLKNHIVKIASTICSTTAADVMELSIRESAHYNDEGDPYCSDCYESNYDDDAPDNPDVSDSDRELVVKLSRSWLQGKIETRRPLFINDKDILLRTIKDKVGLVDNPIYVFGLTDRDEYQLSVTADLFDKVQTFVQLNDIKAIVVSSPGCNRLGISLTLRKNNQKEIIELIKQITTVQRTGSRLIINKE